MIDEFVSAMPFPVGFVVFVFAIGFLTPFAIGFVDWVRDKQRKSKQRITRK